MTLAHLYGFGYVLIGLAMLVVIGLAAILPTPHWNAERDWRITALGCLLLAFAAWFIVGLGLLAMGYLRP